MQRPHEGIGKLTRRVAIHGLTACFATNRLFARRERGDLSQVSVVHRNEFFVVGLSGRTSNAKEASGQGIIGEFWQRLMGEGLLNQITEKVDQNIIAVYSSYQSDEHGEYTYTLGASVPRKPATIPNGFTAIAISGGDYAVFTSARGAVAEVVLDTWKRIWNIKQSHPELRRAYKTDFEIYDERARNPANAQVDIYIGVLGA